MRREVEVWEQSRDATPSSSCSEQPMPQRAATLLNYVNLTRAGEEVPVLRMAGQTAAGSWCEALSLIEDGRILTP